MRRPNRKRRHPAKIILWLFVAANVAVAWSYSRFTAIRHIEVFGVRPYDEQRLHSIFANLQNTPESQVDNSKIETQMMRDPSVRYAEFTTNIIGKGNARIVYRRPVARLAGMPDLAIDDDGVVYSAPDLPDDLTPVQLDNGIPPTLVGLMGDWQSKRLADLALRVRTMGLPPGVEIQVDGEGSICLNVGSGRVVLGSFDDLDHKLKVLHLRLQKNRDELSQIEELNLTHPDSPMVVKKVKLKKQEEGP